MASTIHQSLQLGVDSKGRRNSIPLVSPRDSGDQSPGDHQTISFADDTVFEKPETGGDIPEDDEITPLMAGPDG